MNGIESITLETLKVLRRQFDELGRADHQRVQWPAQRLLQVSQITALRPSLGGRLPVLNSFAT